MIGTIRKHQKWLWFIIIGVTIVTFVGFLSPTSKMRSDERGSVDLGSINGRKVSPRQFTEARNAERLGFLLAYGELPRQEEQLRQMGWDIDARTYQHLFLNSKIEEMNIQVSDEAMVKAIKRMFGVEANAPLPIDFNEFVRTKLNPNGLTEEDFQRFVRHQVGQQQLIALFGMNGSLITPKEVESFYRRENEPMSTQVASFSTSNFLSQVTVTPQAVGEYYTNNQAAYRLSDKVAVAYVKFDFANAYAEVDKKMASLTNFDDLINRTYLSRKPESFKDKDGKQMTEADAKALIKKEARESEAKRLTQDKAYNFLTTIYNSSTDKNPFSLSNFEATAKAKGLTVQATQPFDAQTGPGLKVGSDFTQIAFRLQDDPSDTAKRGLFSTRPALGEDGLYAIALKQRIPSQIQPLSVVRDQVTADYRRSKALELANAAGEKFAAAATNGIAAGKSFDQISTAANIKPTTVPPFSLSTTSIPDVEKNEFQEMQRVASTLPTGKSSSFIPDMDGGFVIYVKSRLPVDENKMKNELPNFVKEMRNKRQLAAFNEWFQKQYQEEVRRPQTGRAQG